MEVIEGKEMNSRLLDTEEKVELPKNETYKIAFLITMPVFMGYACCFSLQKKLSIVFGLTDGVSGDHLSIVYGVATSFVYFFNLIFRVFGHNICFACFPPKVRVIISLGSMIIGMVMMSALSFQKTPPHVAWVFISYAFCGVCEGSFGPNMLNVVNHLGDTRLWVVMAMPVGVATITIVAFALMAFGAPFQIFYIITAIMLAIAIVIYMFTIYPKADIPGGEFNNFNLKDFGQDLLEIGHWFPKIWVHSLVFLINMICLSLFNPGCTLFVYQNRVTFRLFHFTLANEWFIFLYNTGSFCGDFFSRRVMNNRKIIHPIFYFFMLIFGFCINVSVIPEIAPFAAFFFSWANGGLYVQSTKYIGNIFQHKYHLTATSTWLFIGDAGSTSGANLVQFLRPAIGSLKKMMY